VGVGFDGVAPSTEFLLSVSICVLSVANYSLVVQEFVGCGVGHGLPGHANVRRRGG
jgi:hypothetical protein